MKKRLKILSVISVFIFSVSACFFSVSAEDIDSEFYESVIMPEDVELHSEYLPDINIYALSEGQFMFFDQLDENNQAVYAVMTNWAEPTGAEFSVTLPKPVSFVASSPYMSKWPQEEYDEFWNLIFQNIIYAEKAVLLDYPEIFWLDTSKLKVSLGNIKPTLNSKTGQYTMRVSSVKIQANLKPEYLDFETARGFKELLDASVAEFEVEGDDRWQQVKYIHDYIIEKVTYDLEAPYHDAAVGVFCEPYRVVCEGYAKSFKLLCEKADIPCVSVPGNIDPKTKIGHMWNYVMMEDGEWYGIDCTWDDIDAVEPGIKYEYFLRGSGYFKAKHIPEEGLEYPGLCFDDYIYIPAPTEPEVPEHLTGDYNMDGEVNIADLVLLRRYIVNKTEADEEVADDDMNGDESIDVLDCVVLMRNIMEGE